MLNIIGGSYIENCTDPSYTELFGSGLRAAAALANKGFEINFHSCICKTYKPIATIKGNTFGFACRYFMIPRTIEFNYYHPLSRPFCSFDQTPDIWKIDTIKGGNFLYYGMAEKIPQINGDYVVYDPQNHVSFSNTGSKANHLAIVLNKNEARLISTVESEDLIVIGKNLLVTESAEVIVLKNGPHGALVFDKQDVFTIPVFDTNYVWPIGSGDIFSAVFAWKWIIEKQSPFSAAMDASKYTAMYCQSRHLPLMDSLNSLKAIEVKEKNRSVYLAGPFFTISERWFIDELRNLLLDFGNDVFSPFHDVGLIDINNMKNQAPTIVNKNLAGLAHCDTILAVISGLDAGTLFEIGYARSLNKKVVILAQNINRNDLTVFIGANCEITDDLSTAIYKASW